MESSLKNRLLHPDQINIFLIITLFLANLPAFSFWFFPWHRFTDNNNLPYVITMIVINSLIWIITAVIILYLLKQHNVLGDFFQAWKKQWFLVAFIITAFISIFWSISPLISAYKVLILVVSSLLGSFIGYRFNLLRWLDLLFWFGVFLIILSIAFALMLPGLGTMPQYPYFGAWCGVFWNRNHLGSLVALLNSVFLIKTLSDFQRDKPRVVLDLFFYLLSLIVVYKATSAAGYILTILLNFLIVLVALWLKFYLHIKKVHYLIIFGLFTVGMVWIASNLDFVFGLVNRTSSLTGRIPMWDFLFQNVIHQSPWLGYGYGAIWSIGSFRNGLSQAVGWLYPVTIGDNGFIDILLSVGIVGLLSFLGVFVSGWIRAFKFVLARRKIIDFFPLVFMLFTLMANISFSLFLETESFIWLIMVAVLFIPDTNG